MFYAICVDNENRPLTKYKKYEVLGIEKDAWSDEYYVVINDNGLRCKYFPRRFQKLDLNKRIIKK